MPGQGHDKYADPHEIGGSAGENLQVQTMFTLTLQYGKLKIKVTFSVTAIAALLIALH